MRVKEILDKHAQKRMVESIAKAEKNTSGEIRIHIESVCKGDPCERAAHVFNKLGMCNTNLHNGVLIYVAYQSRSLSIIGDSGINEKVGADFWNDVRDCMVSCFANGEFEKGLTDAVGMVGEKLKTFFPYSKNDVNELSDEISFGE